MAPGSGRSALDSTINMITAIRKPAVGGTPQRQTITGLTTTGSAATLMRTGIGARHGNLGNPRTATANGNGRSALNSTGRPITAAPKTADGCTLIATRSGPAMSGGSAATSFIRGNFADTETTATGLLEEQCHRQRSTLRAFQVRARARPE